MTEAALAKVVKEIFEMMYEEADPPAKYPSGVKSYEDHYLKHERQMEIVSEICRLRRVGPRDRKRVEMTIYTGAAPNTQR